jgi:uncharacterized OB-fold protein
MSAPRVSIRDGLLTGPLDQLDQVRLGGTKCKSCGEASLGANAICPNCGGTDVAPLAFSPKGTLWTYTVVRNKPPGDYKGPEPFAPFALGLVELPEGLRVLAPLDAALDGLKIGDAYTFHPFVHHRDAEGREVIGFNFKPAA